MPKLDVYRSKARTQRANEDRRASLHERLDRVFDNLDLGFGLSCPCPTDNRLTEPLNETERLEIMPAA